MDRLGISYCKRLKKYGICKIRPVKMAVFCPKTCGFCSEYFPIYVITLSH